MVRIRNADIGRCVGRNIGDDIVVDLTVIGVEPHVHLDIRVESFEAADCIFIDFCLCLVRVILGPEGDLMFDIFVKFLRHHEFHSLRRAVAAREQGADSYD